MTNLGWVLFDLHEFGVVLLAAVYIVRPALRYLVILLFIPIYLFHISGIGCPLTRIEQYFHGQNVTIIDPFLKMVGILPTNKNRREFQAYFSSLILFAMILTVWAYKPK